MLEAVVGEPTFCQGPARLGAVWSCTWLVVVPLGQLTMVFPFWTWRLSFTLPLPPIFWAEARKGKRAKPITNCKHCLFIGRLPLLTFRANCVRIRATENQQLAKPLALQRPSPLENLFPRLKAAFQ